jgi:hypothetical protein
MDALVVAFSRSSVSCKRKQKIKIKNAFFNQYKEDNLANGVFGDD